jgi:hypothetical protein
MTMFTTFGSVYAPTVGPTRVAGGCGDSLSGSVGHGDALAPSSGFWGRRATTREALAFPPGWLGQLLGPKHVAEVYEW